MDISTYRLIQEEAVRAKAQLVIVSKTRPLEKIQAYYDAGHRVFGENRVAELVEKEAALPKDIEWHFIGHLQSKKVKSIASFVSLIHAVDSEKLLREINKQAAKHKRTIRVLLQFHIAKETSKYGFELDEAVKILTRLDLAALQHVELAGVMGMATYTDDDEQIQQEFQALVDAFNFLKNRFFKEKSAFKEISMGMSGDYPLALQEGSTMIRVGTLLFPS